MSGETVYGWDRCTHKGIGQVGCPTCDPDKARVTLRLQYLDNKDLRTQLAAAQQALSDLRQNTEAAESEWAERDKHCARVDKEVMALRAGLGAAQQERDEIQRNHVRDWRAMNDAQQEVERLRGALRNIADTERALSVTGASSVLEQECRAALASSPPGQAGGDRASAEKWLKEGPDVTGVLAWDRSAAPEAARSLSAEDIEKVRAALEHFRHQSCQRDPENGCEDCDLTNEALAILEKAKP